MRVGYSYVVRYGLIMSDDEIKPDHWYACVQCRSCGMAVPLLEIQPDEPIVGDDNSYFLQVKCYYCAARHDYDSKELQRRQARAWVVGST